MTFPRTVKNDYYGGIIMVILGIVAIWQGTSYKIGSLSQMGPGFFPVALGVILALIGIAIALTARFAAAKDKEDRLAPEWRGWMCIGVAIIAFATLGTYGGLVPATFAVVFFSALGDRRNSAKSAAILALAMVVVSITIFWWALRVSLPLFGWG